MAVDKGSFQLVGVEKGEGDCEMHLCSTIVMYAVDAVQEDVVKSVGVRRKSACHLAASQCKLVAMRRRSTKLPPGIWLRTLSTERRKMFLGCTGDNLVPEWLEPHPFPLGLLENRIDQ